MLTRDNIEWAASLLEKDPDQATLVIISVLKSRNLIREIRIREALEQRNLGHNDRASEILLLAIKDAGGGTLLGELYHHLGTNAQGAGNFTKALEYLSLALELRMDAGDNLGAAYTTFQIAMCKIMSRASETELIFEFQNAKRIARAALNEQGLSAEHKGNMHQNLAFCLQLESFFEDAIHEYQNVLQFREEAEHGKEPLERRGTAMTLARIAECLMGLHRYDEATEQALRALAIFQNIADVNRIKQVEATLQQIAEGR